MTDSTAVEISPSSVTQRFVQQSDPVPGTVFGKSKTTYAAGFLFTEDRSHLALVEKQKPAWQAGKLNGIGGKIEAGETPMAAMVREFAEETGVAFDGWEPLAVLTGDDFEVHFFQGFDDKVWDVRTMESERIEILYDDDFLWSSVDRMLPNLRTLISLALDTSGIVKPVMLRDARPQEQRA